MVAVRRPKAIRDFLLIAVSGAVIVLALWPPAPPRQTLLIRDGTGTMQRYSLAVGDPRLERLRAELDKPVSPFPDATLALAMWRVEMADFYAGQTRPRVTPEDSIRRVSFTDDSSQRLPTSNAGLLEAQHEQWVRFGEVARQEMNAIESTLDRLRLLADSAPIRLGDEIPGQRPKQAFAAALAAGVFLALLLAGWARLCPDLRLQVPDGGPAKSIRSDDGSRDLQFAIPSNWVRVHQPAMVLLRRATMVLIVATALMLVTRL